MFFEKKHERKNANKKNHAQKNAIKNGCVKIKKLEI
jgi:hypothetical protein